MLRRALVLLSLSTLVLTGGGSAVAGADAPAPTGWLATAEDPRRAATAVAAAGDRLAPEFQERLRWVHPDGTLQVMVATAGRDTDLEREVRQSTSWVAWYGAAPRFLARVTPDQLAALLADPRIVHVDPDYPVRVSMAASAVETQARGDATSPGVWRFETGTTGLGTLSSDLPGLTADQATGKGVTVAVTDSGIDGTHKDFGGFDCQPAEYEPCESRIRAQVNVEHLVPGLPSLTLPTSDLASGHGTHVSGTIAGNGYYTRDGDVDPARYGGDGHVMGMAPQSSLVVTKNGESQWAGLSTFGLQWQLDNAERLGIRVSSNSWGCVGGCSFNGSSAMAGVLRGLYEKGVVVVFAAGNDAGTDNGAALSGNAQSPYVLGVAAYDHRSRRLAAFSSRGDGTTGLADPATWTPESENLNGVRRPDLAAPGVSVWAARNLTGGTSSLVPRLNTNDVLGGRSNGFVPYATMSGTSMATPHVAGAAALLFSACPDARPLHVMRALKATATSLLSTDGRRDALPYEVGYGRILVRDAVLSLKAQEVCGGGVVNEVPVAAFSAPAEVAVDEAATLDGSGSSDPEGGPLRYEWSLGDGTAASGPVVQHAWRTAGTYAVVLTVTDAHGASATAERNVRVVAPGQIAGTVSDYGRRSGIAGASVSCSPTGAAVTDGDGRFVIDRLRAGTYSCTASADGYRPETVTVDVAEGRTTVTSFALRRGK